MAIKWEVSEIQVRNDWYSDEPSIVDPDLEEAITRVRDRSSAAFFSEISSGFVESKIVILGKPLGRENVSAKSSGARLEPPIPSNATFVKSQLRTSATSRSTFGSS